MASSSVHKTGKSKKKQSHNAFYYFMLDFRKREESNGKYFANLGEVSGAAGLEWQRFSEVQKKPYEVKSREVKNRTQSIKYTSLGENIEVVEKKDGENLQSVKTMESFIENLIHKNMVNDAYADMTFYVAHVNYYCQYGKIYFPAEIAIIRFNLRNGVESNDVFHCIIDQDELPVGFLLTALARSRETHQIPPPPHTTPKIGQKDISLILHQMMQFLRRDSENGKLPPIFCEPSNMDVANTVFRNYLQDYGYTETISINSLVYLFYCMRNAAHTKVADQPAFITKSIPERELDNDVYDYVKGICCPYHSVSDSYPHCSLSKAVRSVYVICDHTCGDLGITLIPGRHVPQNASTNRLASRPPSTVQATWDDEPLLRTVSSMSISERSSASTPTPSVRTADQPMRRPITASRVLDVPPANDALNFPSISGSSEALPVNNGNSAWNNRAPGPSFGQKSSYSAVRAPLVTHDNPNGYSIWDPRRPGNSSLAQSSISSSRSRVPSVNNASVSGNAWNQAPCQSSYAESNANTISSGRGRGHFSAQRGFQSNGLRK